MRISRGLDQCFAKYGISRIRIRFPQHFAYPYAYPIMTDTLRYARDTLIFGKKLFERNQIQLVIVTVTMNFYLEC